MQLIKYRLHRKTVASIKNNEAGFTLLLFIFIIAVVSGKQPSDNKIVKYFFFF